MYCTFRQFQVSFRFVSFLSVVTNHWLMAISAECWVRGKLDGVRVWVVPWVDLRAAASGGPSCTRAQCGGGTYPARGIEFFYWTQLRAWNQAPNVMSIFELYYKLLLFERHFVSHRHSNLYSRVDQKNYEEVCLQKCSFCGSCWLRASSRRSSDFSDLCHSLICTN